MERWRAEWERKPHRILASSEVVNGIAILGWALNRHTCGLAQIPALSLGTSASKVLKDSFVKSNEVVNFGLRLISVFRWLSCFKTTSQIIFVSCAEQAGVNLEQGKFQPRT